MTKADLRTGMVITCRHGNKYIVIKDSETTGYRDWAVSKNGEVNAIDNYNDDLTYQLDRWDIVKVEAVSHVKDIWAFLSGRCVELKPVWERSEKKKYTYSQLKEILGEEFEIVKE